MLWILVHFCPHGFAFQRGDKVGNPDNIKNIQASLPDCAETCNKDGRCQSFEWSKSEQKCNLLTSETTDGPMYEDFIFCTKNREVKGTSNISIILQPSSKLKS